MASLYASATMVLGLLVMASCQNLTTSPSVASAPPEACCTKKAVIVPIVAVLVDAGIPLCMLLGAMLLFRFRWSSSPKQQGVPPALLDDGTAALAGNGAAHTTVRVAEDEQEMMHKVSQHAKIPAMAALLGTRVTRDSSMTGTVLSEIEGRLTDSAKAPEATLLAQLGTKADYGLSELEAAKRLQEYGQNILASPKPVHWILLLSEAVIQPFHGLMAVVAVLTIVPPNNDPKTFTLIMVMVIISILLSFIENIRSRISFTQALASPVLAHARVVRDCRLVMIDGQDVVPGDIVHLSAGALIPGDIRLLSACDFFIGESSLTGESMPVEKKAGQSVAKKSVLDHDNLCLMSTSVVSGHAVAVVLATGLCTYVASMNKSLSNARSPNAFDLAIRRVMYVFICFIAVMVPIVIVLNGTNTGSWLGALAFGLSVAVGLTPQMLSMIVTANLVRGAQVIRKGKCMVRRLDAVQNLGAMDILCTDKTGTLTMDKVSLLLHLNTSGDDCHHVMRLAYANSHFQAGEPNLLDIGVLDFGKEMGLDNTVPTEWERLDEIPFDFQRRRLSVVLQKADTPSASPFLICKGALEEVLSCCTHVSLHGSIIAVDDELAKRLLDKGLELNSKGLRVVGVATREFTKPCSKFCVADEADMCFVGFLAFLDPPKTSAIPAIKDLVEKGISIKVLTGDSMLVAKRLCEEMGIPTKFCVSGSQLQDCDLGQLKRLVECGTVFAKVTPQQKLQVVTILQRCNHIVGFMGDGINDALALKGADVGISVDSGTDIAKEASDLVMMEKDLQVLGVFVNIGRLTYGNMIKYIKFTASSSFGNVFSILAASTWLPFNPMQPIQILLLNILYNFSQATMPFDTLDASFLAKPKRWSAKSLAVYMLTMGPISSIFDICTFCVLWYYFGFNNADDPNAASMFQTGWFLESMFTQTLIVHMLRTEKIPFIQSIAAWPLLLSSFVSLFVGIALVYIPGVSGAFQMVAVPVKFYGFMALLVVGYCCTVQAFKVAYIRVFATWL